MDRDQWLENLQPDLRALALTMRRLADEARQAWLDDQAVSGAGRDTDEQRETPEA